MANFEFTQNLSFGQYIPTGSWIHQRDARARIVVYFSLIIGVTLARHIVMVIIGLIIILVGFFLAKISVRYALNGLKTPLPFFNFYCIFTIISLQARCRQFITFEYWLINNNPGRDSGWLYGND